MLKPATIVLSTAALVAGLPAGLGPAWADAEPVEPLAGEVVGAVAVQTLLQEAAALLRAGDVDGARAKLAAVLEAEPGNATAVALLAALDAEVPDRAGWEALEEAAHDTPVPTLDWRVPGAGGAAGGRGEPGALAAGAVDDFAAPVDGAPPPSPAPDAALGVAPERARSSGGEAGGALRGGRPGAGAAVEGWADDAVMPPVEEGPAPEAGLLTAGRLCDFDDPSGYQAITRQIAEAGDEYAARFVGENFAMRITATDGTPVADALLVLTNDRGEHLATATTGTDGRIGLVAGYDQLVGVAPDGEIDPMVLCTVAAPGAVPFTVTLDPAEPATHEIAVPGYTPAVVQTLDLVFVLDCTGSMGDELRYLKVELQSIVQRVAEAHPGVRQRYALVAYRDTTDEYVTRESEFTTDLDAFIKTLELQQANGGGDYPEAVNSALRVAGDMDYTAGLDAGPAARVAFLIADAPPLAELVGDFFEGVKLMREQGVSLYPVASSGVDDKTQYLFRSAAWMTGADYLFLTDHSGIGGDHAEPKASEYDVEPLNDLMVRVIDAELRGEPVGRPDAEGLIERVGE